jgi:hypothetical protein
LHQRVCQRAGAADGCGEADGLAEHAEQHAEDTRAAAVEGDVRVTGVAGEQDARGLAAEALPADVGDRGEQEPDEVETAGGGEKRDASRDAE